MTKATIKKEARKMISNRTSIIWMIKDVASEKEITLTDKQIERAYNVVKQFNNPNDPNNAQDVYDKIKEYFNN